MGFMMNIESANWPYHRVAAIAKRLGICPVSYPDVRNRVLIFTDKDTCYDLYELINAVLDRFDEITRLMETK